VFRFGLVAPGCPAGYAITRLLASFTNASSPPGWVFPSNEFAPNGQIQLAVVVKDPWYSFALGDPLRLRVEALCQYFPQITR